MQAAEVCFQPLFAWSSRRPNNWIPRIARQQNERGPKGVAILLATCDEPQRVSNGDCRLANPFAGGDHVLAWKSLAQQEGRLRRSPRSPTPTLSANPPHLESSSDAHRSLAPAVRKDETAD